jgi:hypothetical protein
MKLSAAAPLPILFRIAAAWAVALAVAGTSAGCLRPSLQVTSEPAGARVIMNGELAGVTPVEIPFIWYWQYELELRREGYEPLRVRERMYAPPYFYIPLDLIFEILPFQIHDRRYRHYYMEPERAPLSEGRFADDPEFLRSTQK